MNRTLLQSGTRKVHLSGVLPALLVALFFATLSLATAQTTTPKMALTLGVNSDPRFDVSKSSLCFYTHAINLTTDYNYGEAYQDIKVAFHECYFYGSLPALDTSILRRIQPDATDKNVRIYNSDSEWMQWKLAWEPNHYLLMAPYVNRSGELDYKAGRFSIEFADSPYADLDNKWSISRIEMDAISLRAYEKARNSTVYNSQKRYDTYSEFPCEIAVNGKTVALEKESLERQHLAWDFEGDERLMSEVVFSAPSFSGVGIINITLYFDLEESFVSEDAPGADRLRFNSDGSYSLPAVGIGNLFRKDGYRLTILDSEGNVCHTQNVGADNGAFSFTFPATDDGSMSHDCGLYYANLNASLNYTTPQPRIEDSLPFEIVPVIGQMDFNWSRIQIHGGCYECTVPKYRERVLEDGRVVTNTLANTAVEGHLPGTKIYWKLLSDEEADEVQRANPAKSPTRRRIGAEIPSGYRLMTGSGIDLSPLATAGAGGVHLGMVLTRNGVVSDPYLVNCYIGDPITTTVATLPADVVVTDYFTIDGLPADPDRCAPGTLLIRVRRPADGPATVDRIITRR